MKERENKLGLTPRLLRSHTQESNRTQVSHPRRVIKLNSFQSASNKLSTRIYSSLWNFLAE